MTESPPELSSDIRRSAVWCHLGGVLWAACFFANGLVVVIARALNHSGSQTSGSTVATFLLGLTQVLLSVFSLLSFPMLSSVLTSWIVWRIYRDRHSFVDQSGRLVLNFQLSAALYSIIALVLWVFLVLMTCGVMFTGSDALNGVFVGALMLGGVGAGAWMLFQVITAIVGATKAWRGQLYKYPLAFNFLGVEPEFDGDC